MSKFKRLFGQTNLALYDIYINKALRDSNQELQEQRKEQLHASMLDEDHFCVRRALLAMLQKDQRPHSILTLLKFADGHARHKKWQEILDRAHLSTPADTERRFILSKQLYVYCTPDKLIRIGKRRYVWECKGMASHLWRKVQRSQRPPRQFVRRLHLYFMATGINEGILHIDNKDTNEYLAFHVRADAALMRKLERRARRVQEAYYYWRAVGRLPKRCKYEKCSCHMRLGGRK
ncbi:MAG: hypothetical protein QW761_01485 [Candidatus Aenigmatarchaeota archaeon]